MSKMTDEYGFMATDEGDGDITLCDGMGGGIGLSKGPFLVEDIAQYVRSQAYLIAEQIVSDLEDES